MSRAKEEYIEREERGYSDHIKTYVCNRHFEDKGIINFINRNSQKAKCDYCEEEELFDDDSEARAIYFPDLVEHIVKCIKIEYDKPINWFNYESAEDGYQGETFHTEDLLNSEIGLEIDNNSLLDDIIQSINTDSWCESDPYSIRENEELLFTWRSFSQILKHRSRFVFFRTTFKNPDELMEPFEILDKIGKVVYDLKLWYNTSDVAPLFPTNNYYRARQHGPKDIVNSAETLGSPPRDRAMVNRMSPAGIPMFYCSDDEKTAIAETLNKSDLAKPFITIGCFQNTRSLNIIDLNHLMQLSLFEEDKNIHYQAMQFLWKFREEISQPISRDGAEHYEYVPTQVVTEYFRYVFSDKYKIKIDGIKYPSVKDEGNSCYVLFFDKDDIEDDIEKAPVKREKWDEPEKEASLILLQKSLNTIKW